ncbi:hypothetical protein IFM89_033549 [Coptis chinensis]|uniref:Uncharacterized protein n=1 Tax=Coptis chinensis TaxID=261450 RepID=A0A835LK56_9MAGN|nr:hypothetical protein IFM89_033549 [Coptis chinensis]
MSEVKLNKKEKFTKRRNEERNNKFKGNGERRTFKKDGGGDGGDDDKRGNGEGRSFDLKRKRVYGERGVEKEGENSNGRVPKWKSLPRKDGFRKKSGVNDGVIRPVLVDMDLSTL